MLKPYDQLTIFRNRKRVSDLRAFRSLVVSYYERAAIHPEDVLADFEGLQAARAHINRMLPRITQVVEAARTAGGRDPGSLAVGRPAALQHIFGDRYLPSGGQEILDTLDMTIGVYEASLAAAVGRTMNPFYYVGGALRFVLSLPRRFFHALGVVGPRGGRHVSAAEIERIEALAAQLADSEELIERRLADAGERYGRQLAEHAQEITELAERLDFTERVLAQQRALKDKTPQPER